MGGPQDPVVAFHEAYQVLTWRNPPGMRATVRGILSQSFALRGEPPARLAVVEGMMYGCRVAEVLTICLTAGTLQDLCAAFMEERDHVTGMYEENRQVERLWLERAATAGPPQPPHAQWPPQEQPPQ